MRINSKKLTADLFYMYIIIFYVRWGNTLTLLCVSISFTPDMALFYVLHSQWEGLKSTFCYAFLLYRAFN